MPKYLISLIIFAFTVNALSTESSAIVIRHDREDEKYLALGAKYPAVGYFQERVGCTLIAPQWAITAAHTIESNPAFIRYYVMFGPTRYEVEKIILHPARVVGTIDSSTDMALLKLKTPVKGIQPAELYEKRDEPGKQVILVGNGATGNGLSGPTGDRGKLRGATNEIEAALENSLLLIFDAPPFGTELEGIGGAGDSGTPALYEENGKVYIMGVGSFNSGDRKRGNVGKYGTFDGYARISTRRQWILDTIRADPLDTLWGDVKLLVNSKFPDNTFGRRAEAFFSAFNSGKESAIVSFYAEHRPPSSDGKTPAERAKGWQALIDQYKRYEVKGYSKRGDSYAFLVFAPGENRWRGVELEFEKTPPHRVIGIGMWDTEPPKD